MGDFNVGRSNTVVDGFCELYNLKHLIKVATCYKNPENASTKDLMLTNAYRSFQNSCAIETGLSDFHKMTVTVIKTYFKELGAKIINYGTIKTSPMRTTNKLFLMNSKIGRDFMNHGL